MDLIREKPEVLVLIWWGVMSLWGSALTIYDKVAAKRNRHHRIHTRTLLLVAFFGGAEVMYLQMLLIRHKTRHKNFMVGLPLMIVFHGLLVALWLLYLR